MFERNGGRRNRFLGIGGPSPWRRRALTRQGDWRRSAFRTSVVECDMPTGSLLSRDLVERTYFRDAYRAPLSHAELGIADIFFAIFAHHPLWMKLLLIIRNKLAALAGLD